MAARTSAVVVPSARMAATCFGWVRISPPRDMKQASNVSQILKSGVPATLLVRMLSKMTL
jgi:hypothetical protein